MHLPIEVIKFQLDGSHCLFTKIALYNVLVVVMYKSPRFPASQFLQYLFSIIEKENIMAIFVGDTNIELTSRDGQSTIQCLQDVGYRSIFDGHTSSTNGHSCLDWCFSNISACDAFFYETYFSYHKGIAMLLKKTDVHS